MNDYSRFVQGGGYEQHILDEVLVPSINHRFLGLAINIEDSEENTQNHCDYRKKYCGHFCADPKTTLCL